MTTPKITTLEALRAVSQDSPIGLIIESLVTQDFVPIDHEPLTEKDTPVGTLTQMEKAIYDAAAGLKNKIPEFSRKLNEISREVEVIDHRGGDTTTLEKRLVKLHKEVFYAKKISNNLIALLFSFIRQRLCNEGIFNLRHIAIRIPDVIVIPEKKASEESGRTMVIRIGV